MRLKTLFKIKALIYALWPCSVYAAGLSFGQEIISINFTDYAVCLGLSLVSGLVALLQELKDGKELEKPKTYIAYRILSALMSGLVMLFIAMDQTIGSYKAALMISIAAYMGPKFIKLAVDFVSEFAKTLLKTSSNDKGDK